MVTINPAVHEVAGTLSKCSPSQHLKVQLTLEQPKSELCGSTYAWIFPNSKYYSTTQSTDG